jgi:hypothetical protein
MSFVQARLRSKFSTWLHGLSGDEKSNMDALLADIRMMNNPAVHQKLGNARMYTAGFWVRDLPALKGIATGGNRLIYSKISKDANETARGLAGHVEVYGIGDPHTGSGYSQVNKFTDINWLIY